jgi:hypothetical protein
MTTRPISTSLAIAAFMLLAAAALKYGQAHELVSAVLVTRMIQVGIGVVLALYGNFIPKNATRSRAPACTPSRMQSLLRFGGWSFTLAGLGYAGLWAFAPVAVANAAAMPIVAAATVATAGYCGWAAWTCRWRSAAPTARS